MLEHSIFQTEVQFNAPTKSNDTVRDVRGNGPFQTSHPSGKPPLDNTMIIYNKAGQFATSPASLHSGCPTCNPPTGEHWRKTTAYTQYFSSLSAAKQKVEDDGKHWIDWASGKVATTSGRSSGSNKSKSKKKSKKTSWRSRLKALRRKYKW